MAYAPPQGRFRGNRPSHLSFPDADGVLVAPDGSLLVWGDRGIIVTSQGSSPFKAVAIEMNTKGDLVIGAAAMSDQLGTLPVVGGRAECEDDYTPFQVCRAGVLFLFEIVMPRLPSSFCTQFIPSTMAAYCGFNREFLDSIQFLFLRYLYLHCQLEAESTTSMRARCCG